MGVVVNLLILIGGIGVGTLCIVYSFPLTRLFGHNYYAERYLGDGGTYTMWKLIGIVLIAGSVIYTLT